MDESSDRAPGDQPAGRAEDQQARQRFAKFDELMQQLRVAIPYVYAIAAALNAERVLIDGPPGAAAAAHRRAAAPGLP